jgi:hypothetical protein
MVGRGRAPRYRSANPICTLDRNGGAALTGLISSLFLSLRADTDVKKEPAAISLGEFLDTPNYSAELGFVHRAEADLRKVLLSVPDAYQPIVVFIDDLDRCSPAKVGQVIEAINLFLAGDLPKCMFILGMDTGMVAAALEAAHKDMISCLPTDAKIPLGWRFMDKFVQLPFLIPPSEETYLSSYANTLFTTGSHRLEPDVVERIKETAAVIQTRAEVDDAVTRMQMERNLTETDATQIRVQLEEHLVSRTLDEGIASFDDRKSEVQAAINAGAVYFGENPRELKRFINSFRFNYYLWWARRAQGQSAPKLDQLVRWTVLSMKWPEVVRWMRRGRRGEYPVGTGDLPGRRSETRPLARLGVLEDISKDAANLSTWHAEAETRLRLDAKQTSWLRDDDLYRFFRDEGALPEEDRLSRAAGRGLW